MITFGLLPSLPMVAWYHVNRYFFASRSTKIVDWLDQAGKVRSGPKTKLGGMYVRVRVLLLHRVGWL